MDAETAEDFRSSALLKLMAKDFHVFQQFQGKASLAGYLSTVLNTHLLNYRDKVWGKWRPSTAACRLGQDAVLMERLLTRDAYSFSETIQIMKTNYRVKLSEDKLHSLAKKLPVRLNLDIQGGDQVEFLNSEGGNQEKNPDNQKLTLLSETITSILVSEFQTLAHEDRTILRLHFLKGITIATISKSTGKDQKRLYLRVSKLVKQLRIRLEKEGIDGDTIKTAFGSDHFFENANVNVEKIFS